MNNILSSAHVHTTFCDGKTPAPEMARTAYERGFVSMGFTSHAPQNFDPAHCIAPADEQAYKAQIRSLREEYDGRMAVYLGIERDMFSCSEPEGYDYFIASVHYFKKPDNTYCGVDGDPDQLMRYIREYCDNNGLKMAEQYFSMVRDYVLEYKPEMIGHFDLVRMNNAILHLYDENDPSYVNMALETLRYLCGIGVLLEVNTGAVARGYLPEPYPAPFLLRAWKEWGGEVIVNSDCHNAALLDTGYDQAEELLTSLGYDHIVRLSRTPESGMWERVKL